MPDFALVERATLTPSRCMFCSNQAGPMVDTKANIVPVGRGHGRGYVCMFCAGEVAKLSGWTAPAVAEELRKDRADALATLKAQTSELDALRQIADGLQALRGTAA